MSILSLIAWAAPMTMVDFAYWLFTISNGLRIASYLPQIYRVAVDPYGASAIAYSTWLLWTIANAATALYAVYNVFDPPLAAINLLNALCCLAVILLTMYKRRSFRLTQVKHAPRADVAQMVELR